MSFAYDTNIMTDKGHIPIANIDKGTLVLTRDGYFPVKSVIPAYDRDIWTLHIDGEELSCTHDTKVWSESSHSFHKLSDTTTNDWLVKLDREEIPITTQPSFITSNVSPSPTYDIIIERMHEFFANGVLVRDSHQIASPE